MGKGEIPRYWPILYILSQLTKLEIYRRLQYLIYIAHRQGLSATYDFILSNGNLVSPQIKLDLEFMEKKGLIKAIFHNIWVFEITRRGNSYAQRTFKLVPKRQQRIMSKVLSESKDMSYSKMFEKLTEELSVKAEDLNYKLSNISLDMQVLKYSLKSSLPSHNLLLLIGSLDYVKDAAKRIKSTDNVKKEIPFILSEYIKKLEAVVSLTGKNPEALGNMDLSYIAEDFELLQKVCLEAGMLSQLQEKHDFTIFEEI